MHKPTPPVPGIRQHPQHHPLRPPSGADDQVVQRRGGGVAPAVVELHVVPVDERAGVGALELEVVEAAQVRARLQHAGLEERAHDGRERAVGGGGVEQPPHERREVGPQGEERGRDGRERDDEGSRGRVGVWGGWEVGPQAVEEAREGGEREGFFDVEVYAV